MVMRRTVTSRKQINSLSKHNSQYQQTNPITIVQSQQIQPKRTMNSNHNNQNNNFSISPSLSPTIKSDHQTSKTSSNSNSPLSSPRNRNNQYEMNDEMNDVQSYNLIVTIGKGNFPKGEHGVYCVCKLGNLKWRSKSLSNSVSEFNEQWDISVPENKTQLIIEICKHGKLNKKIVLGLVTVNLTRLGINVEMKESYKIINSKNDVYGTIELSLKRLLREKEIQFVESEKLPEKRKFSIFGSAIDEDDENEEQNQNEMNKPIFRKCYMPQSYKEQDKETVESCGLFSAVFTFTIGNIIDDLLYMKRKEPFITANKIHSIEQLGFTGNITNCYPPNNGGKIVPLNIWNFCFGNGIRMSKTKKDVEIIPFVMTDANANSKYACFLITYCLVSEEIMKQLKEIKSFSKDSNETKSTDEELNVKKQQLHELLQNCEIPDELYVPYVVGVTSDFPLLNLMRKWLKSLYQMNVGNNMKFTEYCHQAIFMSGRPSYGNPFSCDFKELGFDVQITLPKVNDLPPIPTSIIPLIDMIGINGFIAVWLSLLQGDKVLLTSSSRTLLVYAIENLKSSLFPFEWCNICIDLLPYPMIDYLSSPMTYLMGVPSEYKTEMEKIIENEDVVYVDLDTGKVKSKAKVKQIPLLVNSLYHDIKEVINKRMFTSGNINSDVTDDKYYSRKEIEFNYEIRIILFKFINTMLNNYRGYIDYYWIAKRCGVTFSKLEFIYNQPVDRREFLKALFDSQHFSYFVQNFPQRQNHIFEDWQMNNLYLKETKELLKLFRNEYNPILTFREKSKQKTSQQQYNNYHSQINQLILDCSKLKSLRVRNAVVKVQKKSIEYYNHLSVLKTTKKEEFFNTDQIEYCDNQIKLLIEMNEDENNAMEKKLNIEELFSFLSKIEGRKSFFQRLLSQYTQFKMNLHIGQVNALVFSILCDILKQSSIYAYAQKDYMTPQHIVDISKMFYKTNETQMKQSDFIDDNEEKIYIIYYLDNLDIWNKSDIWETMLMRIICMGKIKIYQENYGLDLPSRWNDFDPNQQKEYYNIEYEDFKEQLTNILETITTLKVNEKIIKQFVNFIVGKFKFGYDQMNEIEEIVKKICATKQNILDRSSKDKFVESLEKLYECVYQTE